MPCLQREQPGNLKNRVQKRINKRYDIVSVKEGNTYGFQHGLFPADSDGRPRMDGTMRTVKSARIYGPDVSFSYDVGFHIQAFHRRGERRFFSPPPPFFNFFYSLPLKNFSFFVFLFYFIKRRL